MGLGNTMDEDEECDPLVLLPLPPLLKQSLQSKSSTTNSMLSSLIWTTSRLANSKVSFGFSTSSVSFGEAVEEEEEEEDPSKLPPLLVTTFDSSTASSEVFLGFENWVVDENGEQDPPKPPSGTTIFCLVCEEWFQNWQVSL